MITQEEMVQILQFVSKRWTDISREPENKIMKTLQKKKIYLNAFVLLYQNIKTIVANTCKVSVFR